MDQSEFRFAEQEVMEHILPWEYGICFNMRELFHLTALTTYRGRPHTRCLVLGLDRQHASTMFHWLAEAVRAVSKTSSPPGWATIRQTQLQIDLADSATWYFTESLLDVKGRSLDIALYPTALQGLAVSALTPCMW